MQCGADWRYVKGQAGAAWALGNRSPPAVRMRILSRLRSIYGLSFSYPFNAYDAVEESTWSGMEAHLKAHPELTSDKLDAALDALATFQKYPGEYGTDPRSITQLVEVPGQLLRILLLHTNWREHESSIRAVQSLARTVCQALVNSKWAKDQQSFALFGLKRDLAPYWCDNVKDVVSTYQEILLIPRTAWFNQGDALSFRSRTIDKLLFGDESSVKSVAITGENANAFVPNWMFRSFVDWSRHRRP